MFSSSRTGRNDNRADAPAYYRAVFLVLAGSCLVLQAAALGPLRGSFWGFHLYAFVPRAAYVAAWILAALSAVLMLWPRFRPAAGRRLDFTRFVPDAAGVALLTAACTLLFWFLRSRQSLLGDSLPLMIDLPGGQDFHPRQPLTMWLQQFFYRFLRGIFSREGGIPEDVAFDTTAAGSVLAGALFVPVAYGLGRALTKGNGASRLTPWLVALLFLVQGYAVLFFGYVENYTFYALAAALFLLTALACLNGARILPVTAILLVLCTGLHLSAVALIPSFLYLVSWSAVNKKTRVDALTGLAAAAVGFVLLEWLLRKMSPGFGLLSGVGQMINVARTPQGGGAGLGYTFSWAHVRDFANAQFLIGPVASFVLVPAVAFALARRAAFPPPAVFLTLVSGVLLAGSWMMSEPLLGYARDWDLFAPAGVCYCAAAVYLIVRHVGNARAANGLLGFAVVISLVQFVPWVWTNHSETAALERFKALPLGHGRTEVAVGNWYLRHREYKDAERWFEMALQVNPNNANANSMMGRIYAREGKFEIAGRYFERAVALRPDKIQFRQYYVRVLLELSLCEEARPHLLWLSGRVPDDVGFWHSEGDVLLRLGCRDVLREVYEPVIRAVQDKLLEHPDNERANIDAGIFLGRLERNEEALVKFQRALAVNPNSAAALFNTASTLSMLGREEEAEPLFRKFLALYPDHDLADHVRSRLSG